MTPKEFFHFPLTKIIIGIAAVVGSVALVEWTKGLWLPQSSTTGSQPASDVPDLLFGLADTVLAVSAYVLLFRWYEQRKIKELSAATLLRNATLGLLTGLAIQSLVILLIERGGGYRIIRSNPVSFLLPGLTAALVAGFVAEIILRGVIFRVIEEKWGSVVALVVMALLFGVMHAGKGATVLSVTSTVLQAGVLYSAVYMYSRSLWFPIFLHFGWDLAQPGIYGAVNPGINIDKTLLESRITGPEWLTGGAFGPCHSLPATILCLLAALLFLWLARRKGNFIGLTPYGSRNTSKG